MTYYAINPLIQGLLTLVLLLPSLANADVWAFVDEKGLAHFATYQLDPRYQLFAKIDDTPPVASQKDDRRGKLTDAATPATVPVGGNKKLLALFDISPDFLAVRHHVRKASQRHGVGYELLQALIATESGFDRNAVSPKGAIGLMQLMPATALRFGVTHQPTVPVQKRLLDPATNIDAGTRYLRYLIDMFAGDLDLALAAYNAGEGAVARAGRKIPNFPETQNYVKTVRQLHHLLLGPGRVYQASGLVNASGDAVGALATTKTQEPLTGTGASMMVPGVPIGRGNMVPPLGAKSGQVTLNLPADTQKTPY